MNKYISIGAILLVIIFTIFIKCFNIEINKFFSIIFICVTSVVLLHSVNDFIADIISGIKSQSTDIENSVTDENNQTDKNNEINIKIYISCSQDKTKLNNFSNIDYNSQMIGFLERILYFIGIVFQNMGLVTIVMAFKTVARYKEIDEKMKAEYFLIGSFLSLISSIIISGIFIAFDNIHNLGIVNYVVNLITYNLKIIN
ncbi:hypothetical protein ACN9JZ_03630 [Aliarcobacter butzleri]|uniref:Uncharacterized protein n=1 Tax=Aliarcobacter vitoriensis TaxID=2011099 RepID=A0A366MTP1_9BACT|nr:MULTISPECIES: hypothetical protein [Aliarcobacter]MCT7581216.1 hypothetical protein [Aliarcobacter butzleri]RBQ28762.1 hypothetical protein CRU91_07920 [Aliarcobacter vitoriensis]